MSEQRKRSAAGDDALATMNDHLARFFQHADVLLREWKEFGDKLRGALDAQVRELEGMVARSMTEAGRAAASELDRQMEQAMAQAVDASVATLRRELEALAALAGKAGARQPGAAEAPEPRRPARAATRPAGRAAVARPVVLALTTANVMLVVLLLMSTRMCRSASPAPEAQGVTPVAALDAGPAPEPAPSAAAALCASLAEAYDLDAARAFVAAAATELCPAPLAAGVAATLSPRLGAAEEPARDDASEAKKPAPKKGRPSPAPRPGSN